MTELTQKQMAAGRSTSIYEGMTARSIAMLTSGALMVGYARMLGADDAAAGLISSVPAFAGLGMLFSPLIFERLPRRRNGTIFLNVAGRLLMAACGLIALLPGGPGMKTSMLLGFFTLANALLMSAFPPIQDWMIRLIPHRIRGKYFGKRETRVLAVATLVSLCFGQLLDMLKKHGHEAMGFRFVFFTVFLIALLNGRLLLRLPEVVVPAPERGPRFRELFALPLGNKSFRGTIRLTLLWQFGLQLAAPFTTVYMVSRLNMGYAMVTGAVLLSSLSSILAARFWGTAADRSGWMHVFVLSSAFQSAAFLCWIFCSGPAALLMVPLAQILTGVATSGINLSLFNLQYATAPEDFRMVYTGFVAASGGVAAFAGTLAGAALVRGFSSLEASFLGFSMTAFQLVFALSLAVLGCLYLIQRKGPET